MSNFYGGGGNDLLLTAQYTKIFTPKSSATARWPRPISIRWTRQLQALSPATTSMAGKDGGSKLN
jgi:hypothetical protein